VTAYKGDYYIEVKMDAALRSFSILFEEGKVEKACYECRSEGEAFHAIRQIAETIWNISDSSIPTTMTHASAGSQAKRLRNQAMTAGSQSSKWIAFSHRGAASATT
jgi:hypothetical protein